MTERLNYMAIDETQPALFDVTANDSRYTGEHAYVDHVKQMEGPDAVPRTPYLDLSDMAIQCYEEEAALVNAFRSGEIKFEAGEQV